MANTACLHEKNCEKTDVNLNGQMIKKGDKVVMWYVSGNRDERIIEKPGDQFKIDRHRARNHLFFWFWCSPLYG